MNSGLLKDATSQLLSHFLQGLAEGAGLACGAMLMLKGWGII